MVILTDNGIKTLMFNIINNPNIYAKSKSLEGNEKDFNFSRINRIFTDISYSLEGRDNNSYTYSLLVGSGDTPATPGDYEWNNDISTVTGTSYSLGFADRNGRKVIRATVTYANNTDTDIEVKEVGLIASYGKTSYLLAREVLKTPMTIKANGGIQTFGMDIM